MTFSYNAVLAFLSQFLLIHNQVSDKVEAKLIPNQNPCEAKLCYKHYVDGTDLKMVPCRKIYIHIFYNICNFFHVFFKDLHQHIIKNKDFKTLSQ